MQCYVSCSLWTLPASMQQRSKLGYESSASWQRPQIRSSKDSGKSLRWEPISTQFSARLRSDLFNWSINVFNKGSSSDSHFEFCVHRRFNSRSVNCSTVAKMASGQKIKTRTDIKTFFHVSERRHHHHSKLSEAPLEPSMSVILFSLCLLLLSRPHTSCADRRWHERTRLGLHQCQHHHGNKGAVKSYQSDWKGLCSNFLFFLWSPAWNRGKEQQFQIEEELHRHAGLLAKHHQWLLEDGVSGELSSHRHDHERSGTGKGEAFPNGWTSSRHFHSGSWLIFVLLKEISNHANLDRI